VVAHYQDSRFPIGELVVGLEEQSGPGEQREAWKTERNRVKPQIGFPAPEARG